MRWFRRVGSNAVQLFLVCLPPLLHVTAFIFSVPAARCHLSLATTGHPNSALIIALTESQIM